MNTFTNTVRPEKAVHRTARNNLFHHAAIVTVALALITAIAIAANTADRSVVAENNPAVPYSNALELQYARPWLEAQNKPVVTYGNALEMQYAQPWLEAQNKPVVTYGNALELQYARSWLEAQNKPVVTYGNALEMQYAQPWLEKAEPPIAVTSKAEEQIPLNCHSNIEMLYACKYGYGLP